MTKIFILDNQYTGPKSQADLSTLATDYGIFEKPDLLKCDFNQNFSGLNVRDNPTFIIPGGAALSMGRQLGNNRAKITDLVCNQGANFLGVCAGGYVATSNADIFQTSYELDESLTFLPPTFSMSSTQIKANFDICKSFQSVGPFYPNDTYVNYENKEELKEVKRFRPHCVDITFSGDMQSIPQLFVEGCGFESVKETLSSSDEFEIVATYKNDKPYHFFYPEEKQTKMIEELPSIIKKKIGPKGGGVLLSGTHIEACVKNSEFLNFFTKEGQKVVALSEKDKEKLESSQEKAREKIVPLLKDTFFRG